MVANGRMAVDQLQINQAVRKIGIAKLISVVEDYINLGNIEAILQHTTTKASIVSVKIHWCFRKFSWMTSQPASAIHQRHPKVN